MTRHDRVSSADPAGPKMSNEARARAHSAGFLDLGTLPSMKHHESRPLPFTEEADKLFIFGTLSWVTEQTAVFVKIVCPGIGIRVVEMNLVNSWRDHYG
jgi:hypothetical protein